MNGPAFPRSRTGCLFLVTCAEKGNIVMAAILEFVLSSPRLFSSASAAPPPALSSASTAAATTADKEATRQE
ncbi:MAG: hypothetical protein FD153_919 [Rhodospirillaceae bacterium]|nr:MAG: hypothetical protein FD153_919 [Rhodospirillaceae bacterium]